MSDKQGRKRGGPKGSQDFPKCGTGLPVATAPQGGISATVKSDALVESVLSNPRHEAYAQAVADGASYADAYRLAGYVDNNGNAYKPAAIPTVAARIRMLSTAAAERRVQSIAARMDLLDTIVHTNADEVVRVVSVPCPGCWSELAIADAMGRALAGKAATPNLDAAQPDCKACRGLNVMQALKPTDELSAAGRAIFRGVKLTANGIEPVLADRQQALAELNRMQPGALAATRSLSLSINAMVPAARDPRDPDAALRLFDAFGNNEG
jgi:hypothetical protein